MGQMDSEFKSFLIGKAITWAQQVLGVRDVKVIMDEGAEAEVWGENVLSWYMELLIPDAPGFIPVEISIDRDGCVSVNRLEAEGPQLKHLWPAKS